MMKKLLCVKNVQDKHTAKNYTAGKSYDFPDETRAKEVLASVYFKEVKENNKTAKTEKQT